MQTDTDTMREMLAGTYLRDRGRDIARKEILAGLKAPSPAVLGMMRGMPPHIGGNLAAGYLDVWRALLGA